VSDRITAKQRRAVIARANQYCEYCYSSMAYSAQSFSVEHTIPRFKGGRNILENLALACQGCNNFKHTKTEVFDPVTNQTVPLFNPRQHQWSEHFRWQDDYMTAIGITPIGRVTVKTLKLNRTGVVNLRRALFILGEHPPIETLR
jgi:HNH endonuclease